MLIVWTTYHNFKRKNEIEKISSTLVKSADKLNTSSEKLTFVSEVIQVSTLQQIASTQYISEVVSTMKGMTKRTTDNVEVLISTSEKNIEEIKSTEINLVNIINTLEAIQKAEEKIRSKHENDNKKLIEIVTLVNELKNITLLINNIIIKGILSSLFEKMDSYISENITENVDRIDDCTVNLLNGLLLTRNCLEELRSITKFSDEIQCKILSVKGALREQHCGLIDIADSSVYFQSALDDNQEKSGEALKIANELLVGSKEVRSVILQLSKITNN
jgi:methyl-accepting chemotaxis protein